jgi:hypothetical protein
MRVLRLNRNRIASQFDDQIYRAKTQIGRVVQQSPGNPLFYLRGVVSRLFFSQGCGSSEMAAEEEKQEGKGFTVQDRRRFSPETGEAREDAAEAQEAANQASPQTTAAQERVESAAQPDALPEIDFSTFVISLSTQVLMHLGEIANPVSGNVEADISVAKQMIDILAMLNEKTRGNLNANEAQLMEGILFDLRMKYVEAVKKR